MEKIQELTVGLEIHAELKTRTKMFCDSLNDPDEKHPNMNVCPVCLGHPGALPVINKQAVESMIRIGFALGGEIARETKFDRKNYFYPDLPKGYQISQFDVPIVSNATLEIEVGGVTKKIRIRRVHLEEDAGSLMHHWGTEGPSKIISADSTYEEKAEALNQKQEISTFVNYNRAGVPLMELVTEPDIRSPEEAVAFAKELQLILRALGVSDANMEKGQMRVEANTSVSMGTRTEVKNLNSFRSVGDAISYEFERQKTLLDKGEKIKQETRGWDEAARKTVSQRSKEDAHDYRYFPEPDLPPFTSDAFNLEALRASIPELPAQKRVRFAKEYGWDATQIEILVSRTELADYIEEAISELREKLPTASKTAVYAIYNLSTSAVAGLMNQTDTDFASLKINPEHLAHLVALLEEKKITSQQAKDVLAKMFETGQDPEEAVRELGFDEKIVGNNLDAILTRVIHENLNAVADYKKGKTASLQFLVGKVMAETKGKANPEEIRKFLQVKLASD